MKRFLQNTSVKSIIGNILMLMLFSVIVILMGQQSFTDALLHQYSEGAFLTASAGTTEINPNHGTVCEERRRRVGIPVCVEPSG